MKVSSVPEVYSTRVGRVSKGNQRFSLFATKVCRLHGVPNVHYRVSRSNENWYRFFLPFLFCLQLERLYWVPLFFLFDHKIVSLRKKRIKYLDKSLKKTRNEILDILNTEKYFLKL